MFVTSRHPHVDKDNTPHYDYSGLVYLSNYDQDFTGGLFTFIEAKTAEFNVIEPSEGRLLIFNAGRENLHQVSRVVAHTSLPIQGNNTRERFI